ncbi:hypothetical protein INR49_032842 [Caranx melampygus]|nr:hypothetical protein INR49_032842 [Caranx melampygus]
MPTSPVKTRIPLTSFGHLITEVKKQLFGIEAPASVELTGWRKYFNSYTLQGRRNRSGVPRPRLRVVTREGIIILGPALRPGSRSIPVLDFTRHHDESRRKRGNPGRLTYEQIQPLLSSNVQFIRH